MMNSITKLKNSLYGAGPGTANKKQVWRDAMDLLIDSTPQKLYTSTTIDFSNPFVYNSDNYYIFNLPPMKVPANWKLKQWEWEISGLHPGYNLVDSGTEVIMLSSFDGPVNAENQLDNLDNYFNALGGNNGSSMINNPLITNSPWVCSDSTNRQGGFLPYVNMEDAYLANQEAGSTAETMTSVYGHAFPNSWEDIGGGGYWQPNMYHPLARTNTAELSYFSTPKTIHTCIAFWGDKFDSMLKDSFDGETFTIKIDIQKYK